MLDTPRRLHIGGTTAVVPRRHRASDFAPLMYVDNPERSADTMLDEEEEEEDAAAAAIPSTEPPRGTPRRKDDGADATTLLAARPSSSSGTTTAGDNGVRPNDDDGRGWKGALLRLLRASMLAADRATLAATIKRLYFMVDGAWVARGSGSMVWTPFFVEVQDPWILGGWGWRES